jgi:hypothetical protein
MKCLQVKNDSNIGLSKLRVDVPMEEELFYSLFG